MLLAIAAAEGGVRLLAPREEPIEPARIDLRTYFTDEEIRRGAQFARPQMALDLTRATIELGALASVVRRPPRWLSRPFKRPVVGGAAAGAGLAVALSLPAIPLRAIARRRARRWRTVGGPRWRETNLAMRSRAPSSFVIAVA